MHVGGCPGDSAVRQNYLGKIMAKSQAGKGLSAAKRAAKAPSPVTVTPADVPILAAMLTDLTKEPTE